MKLDRNKSIIFLFCLIALLSTSASYEKPSQMAKLMTKMLDYVKAEKVRIEKSEQQIAFPKYFKKVSTAKVTKTKDIPAEHQQYSEKFLQDLNLYYTSSNPEDRKSNFNLLVKSCISCHEHECPGPIVVIKKYL
jgi:hypothetical protein